MQDYKVPMEIQSELGVRVREFNKKCVPENEPLFYTDARGKFIYVRRLYPNNTYINVCRLTYNGDLTNMEFALYDNATRKFDPNLYYFPGFKYVDGTLEGALMAGFTENNSIW